MKKLVLSASLLFALSAQAQWVVKKLDNGFDTPFKIAYTEDGQRPFLKMERYEGAGVLIFKGVYFCGSPIFVELSFQVNGVNKQYGRVCELNEDETTCFITFDIKNEDFFNDFKNCTSVKVRVTDASCSETGEIYTFKMNGSTAAVNFILTP
jgi:hypothetical protein